MSPHKGLPAAFCQTAGSLFPYGFQTSLPIISYESENKPAFPTPAEEVNRTAF